MLAVTSNIRTQIKYLQHRKYMRVPNLTQISTSDNNAASFVQSLFRLVASRQGAAVLPALTASEGGFPRTVSGL